MSFRELYPKQVTLCEDGIYRWSVDADLSRDHFSRNYLLKILLITCGIVCAITLVAMFSAGDFTFWWIPVAICVAVVVIGMLGYRIYRGVIDDRLTVGFEMSEEEITLVRNPGSQRAIENAAVVMSLIKPTTGAAMSNAAQPQTVQFKRVRKFREYPEGCMIVLSTWIRSIQVWIPEEDREMVLSFLHEHTDAAIRKNQRVRWPIRLGIAAAISLAIIIVLNVINYNGFQETKRLPISVDVLEDEVVHQKSFGLTTMFIAEGSTREEPWWMNQLKTDTGLAFMGFLLFTVILFLVMTVIGIFRRGGERPDEIKE